MPQNVQPPQKLLRRLFGAYDCQYAQKTRQYRTAGSRKFPLEISGGRSGDWTNAPVILGTRHFLHGTAHLAYIVGFVLSIHPAIPLNSIPGHGESAWIFHMNLHFHRLAAIDNAEPLHHVKFVRMRRKKTVDEGPGVQSDRIDHQCITFIMAYRFAEP